ncbi:glutathione S-transferase N-terminal domain-containing protein [Acidihalobacter aeolianus]|uniref:glutathione S-transferase N-terminal domain-containing protein n=1 Tax=Acidihalobacter aeolianus TaxID=2792603 RepID=UPI000B2D9A95|nr:glutathione S-transferase N-terminal domain-containing protein [Acidihalobacter aeolianus]
MKIYGDAGSGNCYKIKLLCGLLDIPHEWVAVDIMAGGTDTGAFLRMNPNGKIPVAEFDDGRYLAESNAIVNYLARGSALLPDDPWRLAKVQE